MSKCISRHGEFSEHTLDANHVCTLCLVLDEDALIEELRQARESVASLTAENERLRADGDGMLEANVRLRDERDAARAEVEYRKATEADLRAENERLRAHILDIDAHATPYGDIPDEPGWVGTYLLTAGALHRALGKIGHSAPSCDAEAMRDHLLAERDSQLKAARAVGDGAQQLCAENERLRAQVSSLRELESAARTWRACVAGLILGSHEKPLVAAVDALPPTPPATEGGH